MKKIKIIITIFVIIAMILNCFTGCGKKSGAKAFVGTWVNCEDESLIIESDYTWRTTFSYGSGTWKITENDKNVAEFSDVYGDIETASVEEDDLGEFIKLNYGWGERAVFYRDSYPTKEEISSLNAKNATPIEPFQGIEYEISGISPCIEIAVNNSNCSDLAQKYVKYEFDKEYYANGETAKVTATLTNDKDYKLTEQSSSVNISGNPEYISVVTEDVINSIKKELDDFVESNIAMAVKNGTEGWSYSDILGTDTNVELKKVSNLTQGDTYLSTLKLNKEVSEELYHNIITFTYSGKYEGDFGSGNFYSCVNAVNIIKYPNGTIKWGSESPDSLDFVCEGSTEGMEYSISAFVMSKKTEYNITKI